LGKNTKIPLNAIEKSFRMMNLEISLDEVECLVANQIFMGKKKIFLFDFQIFFY
jgi:hypothetical protein